MSGCLDVWMSGSLHLWSPLPPPSPRCVSVCVSLCLSVSVHISASCFMSAKTPMRVWMCLFVSVCVCLRICVCLRCPRTVCARVLSLAPGRNSKVCGGGGTRLQAFKSGLAAQCRSKARMPRLCLPRDGHCRRPPHRLHSQRLWCITTTRAATGARVEGRLKKLQICSNPAALPASPALSVFRASPACGRVRFCGGHQKSPWLYLPHGPYDLALVLPPPKPVRLTQLWLLMGLQQKLRLQTTVEEKTLIRSPLPPFTAWPDQNSPPPHPPHNRPGGWEGERGAADGGCAVRLAGHRQAPATLQVRLVRLLISRRPHNPRGHWSLARSNERAETRVLHGPGRFRVRPVGKWSSGEGYNPLIARLTR